MTLSSSLSRFSRCYCISAGYRNGKYEAVDHKSSRHLSQEESDLWRATTPDAVNISDNFSQREFTAALQHLKPGKALFLPVCADSKFPRSGEERLWSRSQNQQSPWGTQRVIDRYLCSVSPTRSSRGLSTPALNH